jgi:hypothetical protein
MKILAIVFGLFLVFSTAASAQSDQEVPTRAFVAEGQGVFIASYLTLEDNASDVLAIEDAPEAFFNGFGLDNRFEFEYDVPSAESSRAFVGSREGFVTYIVFAAQGNTIIVVGYVMQNPADGFTFVNDYIDESFAQGELADAPSGFEEHVPEEDDEITI